MTAATMTAPDRLTDFARWRQSLGLTQAEAARALGLSVSRVGELEAGASRTPGRSAEPSRTVRLAMAAIARRLKPWCAT